MAPSPQMLDSPFEALAELEAFWFAAQSSAVAAAADLWASAWFGPESSRPGGAPVLLLPGLGAGDADMALFSRMLRGSGYIPTGWGSGTNGGFSLTDERRLVELVRGIHAATGRKVSLVGWSMGGIYARAIAQDAPECVEQVISLGTPFKGIEHTAPARIYERMTGKRTWDFFAPEVRDRLLEASEGIPVPYASLFSRADGIAAWRFCVADLDWGSRSQSIEISGQHFGMPSSREAFGVVLRLLGRAGLEWEPDPAAFDGENGQGFHLHDESSYRDEVDPIGRFPAFGP